MAVWGMVLGAVGTLLTVIEALVYYFTTHGGA